MRVGQEVRLIGWSMAGEETDVSSMGYSGGMTGTFKSEKGEMWDR